MTARRHSLDKGGSMRTIHRFLMLIAIAAIGLPGAALAQEELDLSDRDKCWEYANGIMSLPNPIPYDDPEGLQDASMRYSAVIGVIWAAAKDYGGGSDPTAINNRIFLESCLDFLQEDLRRIRSALEERDLQATIAAPPEGGRGGGRGGRPQQVDPAAWQEQLLTWIREAMEWLKAPLDEERAA